MSNPKKDLVEAILELRQEVERQLRLNKYYVAMGKLDELLAGLKPLESIEISVGRDAAAKPEADAEAAAPSAPTEESERTWSGVVKETVVDELRAP
jgi:hypothetical protein